MIKKQTAILTLLLLLGVLVAHSLLPVWAGDPPIETKRIFDDRIEVIFNQTDGTPSYVRINKNGWEYVTPGKAWICAGTPPVEATIDPDGSYYYKFTYSSSTTGIECFEILNAGPRSSGCPVYANPTYYLYGGDAYRR